MKHKLVNYFRFVDDILLIFDTNKTNIHSILTDLNTLHPNLKFTAEIEHNNAINFLDTTIHRTQDSIKVSIYRKLTFTDTIIP
jgi:type II restriction/modification system DNA methylase subunit YeeA